MMIKKKRLFAVILFYTMMLCSCGGIKHYSNLADDDLSRAIEGAVGNDYDYHSMEIDGNGNRLYFYEIRRIDKEAVYELVNVVNEQISEKSDRVQIMVQMAISGGDVTLFSLRNYSLNNDDTQYEKIKSLSIGYSSSVSDKSVFDPMIYSGIEEIKELYVCNEMQMIAEEKGIDWYSYWPMLEVLCVVE